MDDGLRIVRMAVRNFKRLRAVDVEPQGDSVVVAGRNAQGKSSVLDAILAAIGGKRLCPPVPVRLGAERAEIVVDLGELEVLRVFAADGATTLRVRGRDGAQYPSPQALLDGIAGPFLDPLAFTRLKPEQQRATLLELLDLGGFDLAASEAREAGARSDRTEAQRELRRVAAERDGIGLPPDLPPGPAPDVAAAVSALEAVMARNAGRAEQRQRLAELRRELLQAQDTVPKVEADVAAELDALRSALAAAERRGQERIAAAAAAVRAAEQAIAAHRHAWPESEGDPRADELAAQAARRKVDEARVVEQAVHRRERWRALDLRAEELERSSAALTARIDQERADRSAALAAAGIPVEGLEVADDGLRYRGVPLAQASQSEQLRVAVALAMAREPRLRVLRVQEASVLDPESLALLRDLARERGWQLWLERIDPAGADLVIEDGMVAGG